ncbi:MULTISPECIES: LacI family DNA-binding transcriptional regulator [Nonomuraea]|uniref:DNA-binding LacI/PurR family transcriptional regulator n=1 Tax=Nonomuraea angiospora TaxID=46172 RepID=A0ABR9LNW2_9ACTN|nr:LacI family DNA-binding transcriptional regulator [Nonomuraea angiospora]MBE1582329.1 DNA-binding LacI/PurR family transcriptional regulator [Nonomuraea angiospora]
MTRRPHTRPPVLADVARVAGVSVPTVSRVLSGSAPVSADKRRQVLRAIQELGYRPNAAARALATGRRSIISVLTSDTTRYGYASAIRGIEEAARAVGLVVALTMLDGDDEESARVAVDLALDQPLAGMIVLEFDIQGSRALAALPDTVPVAAVSSAGQGRSVPRALFDDHAGARDATNYLLGLGHRTVHHVGIPASGRPSGRLLGWREALEAAGAPVPEIVESDGTPRSGLQAGARLARRGDVTAVLCGNDEVAFGVIKALQDEGSRVPEDVSVVGFDDHPLAEIWTPSLTTMSQDFAELGRMAVDFLLGRLAGVPVATPRSTPRLVVRKSTAPPAR